MGGKSSSSSKAPSPDPRIGDAAIRNAELGEGWLKFAQEQFAQGNERQQGIDDLNARVINEQLETQDQSNRWATEDRARYTDVFRPMEDDYLAEAKAAGSAGAQEQAAAEARADVQGSAASQRRATERNMASMGVNPNSGRYQGAARAQETDTALASAGAQNMARQQEEDRGRAMRADAINLGRGLPSQAAGGLGMGLQAGNTAVGNATAGEAVWRGNSSVMGQGFSGAMQGSSNQGNILGNLYGNQLGAWQAQQNINSANTAGTMGLIGNLAGAAADIWSSKEVKTNKQPVKDGAALAAVKGLDVEQWDYKPGVADGGSHVGPYAEDFQRETGLGDGQKIPVQDAIGVTMKAVQELDAKVDQLAGGGPKQRKARPEAQGLAA